MKSNFLNMNWQDLLRGFIVAFLTVLVTSTISILDAGEFPTWNEIVGMLKISAIAGLAYILKNLLTNSEDKFLKKESVKNDLE